MMRIICAKCLLDMPSVSYSRLFAICRIVLWLFLVLPWGLAIGIAVAVDECYFRRHVMRGIMWNYLSLIFPDLIELSSFLKNTYGKCIYRQSATVRNGGCNDKNSRIVLTIDDCPGDSPVEMKMLLDVLDKYNAKCTFFCTTDFITKSNTIQATKIMQMVIQRGHELGNHMPEDRSYFFMSATQFESELLRAEEVLHRLDGKAIDQRWYRPPLGHLSKAMVSVLEKRGYRGIVMGDVFSNDALVGGTLDPPDSSAINYHIKHTIRRTTPGSIVVFHCPNSSSRRQLVPILSKVLQIWRDHGWSCCSMENYHTPVKEGASQEMSEE